MLAGNLVAVARQVHAIAVGPSSLGSTDTGANGKIAWNYSTSVKAVFCDGELSLFARDALSVSGSMEIPSVAGCCRARGAMLHDGGSDAMPDKDHQSCS